MGDYCNEKDISSTTPLARTFVRAFGFIIALTGALYAFQEVVIYRPYKHVQIQSQNYLVPRYSLKESAVLPDKDFHGIKYNKPGRAAEAVFTVTIRLIIILCI